MSLLLSFTGGQNEAQVDAAIAEISPDWVEAFDPRGTANAIWGASANSAILQRCIAPKDLTISAVRLFVAVAAGNLDAGVYGPNGADFTRLASSGSTVAAGTAATQDLVLSGGAIQVARGTVFYLALAVSDATTLSVARLTASANLLASNGLVGVKATSLPLPATITGPLSTIGYAPWLRTVP